MVPKETAVSLLMCGFVSAAAFLVGPGCFSPPPAATPFCCTRGDSATAYLTVSQDCPAGFRCISSGDAANAALYATCGTAPTRPPSPVGAVSSPRPMRPGEGITPTQPSSPGPAKPTAPQAAAPLTPSQQPPVQPLSCYTECPPAVQNPRCILAGPAPASYAAQLSQLTGVLAKERSARIDLTPYSRAIGVAAGAPLRGPLTIENERLTNSGAPVIVEGAAPALAATARIELPATVDAAIERRGAVTIFRLPLNARGVSVRLMNAGSRAAHPLDARAGGRILAVETDGQSIFLQTSSACLKTILPVPGTQGTRPPTPSAK